MNLNYRIIFKVIGVIVAITGASMLPSFFAACVFGEYDMAGIFMVCGLATLLTGLIIMIQMKPVSLNLHLQEGYLVVALCWLIVSIIGAIPYYASLGCNSVIDAFFESVSGFTTTGCTVMNVDTMPKSLMLWKAVAHWLGGMGILVFAISILPTLGIGAQKIIKAETPGPKMEKMRTKISDSAKVLYIMYISFTIIEFVLLVISPMGVYDALINTLGSISTGGLFSHSGGLAYYDSVYIELVIAIFTILASVNFSQYDLVLKHHWRAFFKNIELRAFLLIIAGAFLLVSGCLFFSGYYDSIGTSMRYAFFQVTSFATTSGYTITDFDAWPTLCKMILFMLMFIGGCSASTCGSIKVVRILIVLKLIGRGFYKRIHPRAVVAVKLGGEPVSADIASTVTGFVLTYIAVFLAGCTILSLDNLDFETTISAAAGALSNTGLGFGMLGATANFGMFSGFFKIVLSLLMIIGRLELFTVIMLFSPSFWNNKK